MKSKVISVEQQFTTFESIGSPTIWYDFCKSNFCQ